MQRERRTKRRKLNRRNGIYRAVFYFVASLQAGGAVLFVRSLFSSFELLRPPALPSVIPSWRSGGVEGVSGPAIQLFLPCNARPTFVQFSVGIQFERRLSHQRIGNVFQHQTRDVVPPPSFFFGPHTAFFFLPETFEETESEEETLIWGFKSWSANLSRVRGGDFKQE